MNVKLCPACRSLILADFRFCPYCGLAVKGPGLSEALEEPFARLGGEAGPAEGPAPASQAPAGLAPQAQAPAAGAFARAEASLDRLELDMELILEELEKEGRSSK
jgi:hypothetical protein